MKRFNTDRILLILPCCIGDVVLATGVLEALRQAFPHAHITWAISTHALPAIDHHPALDEVLITGEEALPVKSWRGFWQFVQSVREGDYTLILSLVRSPLMSLAVRLARPRNARSIGLSSGWRGFGYDVRVSVTPHERVHELDIYGRVLLPLLSHLPTLVPTTPTNENDLRVLFRDDVAPTLQEAKISPLRYVVVNPTGGNNPGMTMVSKRYPAPQTAQLAIRLSQRYHAPIVLLGGEQDAPILEAVSRWMNVPHAQFAGVFNFPQIGALAFHSLLYVGNDTGITHYASATGAKTVMLMGPTDPLRYAPRGKNAHVIWKPSLIDVRGVAGGENHTWQWQKDGISVAEAFSDIVRFVGE